MRRMRLALPIATVVVAAVVLAVHGCENASPPAVTNPSAPLSAIAVAPPASVGQWSARISWPLVTIHAHLLPNGKVLGWSGYESVPIGGPIHQQSTYVWDPATGTFTNLPNLTTDLFCSGHALLADGSLLVAGGHIDDNVGLKHTNTFDYVTGTWLRRADMASGRWYPTVTTLADGRALAVSGQTEQNTRNLIPELWNGVTWTQLTTASLSLPYYPWMFVVPDGRVFAAGSNPTGRLLNTSGTGSWQFVARSNFGWRDYGTAVMYEPGKVMITGGSPTSSTTPPTNTAEVIDLTQSAPLWKYTGAMASARRHPNATILPDGTVLVTGGTSAAGFNNPAGAVMTSELWDPATGRWSVMASMRVQRLYHSVALLLPDGRVLSAGGGRCGSCGNDNHFDAELYSPPYLFKGPRPTILAASPVVTYGQSVVVLTPEAAQIRKVTLVRLSSVTHTFNENQRFNNLPILSRTPISVTVGAPALATLAPPGHYMLFILDNKGVPSVAKIIRIG